MQPPRFHPVSTATRGQQRSTAVRRRASDYLANLGIASDHGPTENRWKRFRKPVLYPLSYEGWIGRIANDYRSFRRSG